MYQVICVGSASKDIFFPTKEAKIIEGGSVEEKKLIAFEYGAKYQIDDRYEALGGVAANCSSGLARLGIQVACYSRVGNDELGKWIISELKKRDVLIDFLQVDNMAKTDLSAIIVNARDGERTIFFNRDANEKLDIKPLETARAQWLFVSALNGDWRRNVDEILKKVNGEEINLAFNPGQANIKEDIEKVREIVSYSDILLLNRDEATEIVGKNNDDIKFLFGELKKLGVKVITITDGKEGAYAIDRETIFYAPAIGMEPVETTGAGDGYSAAFLAAFIYGKGLEECLKWGSLNGASVVNYYGAIEGQLTEKEIAENLNKVETRIL